MLLKTVHSFLQLSVLGIKIAHRFQKYPPLHALSCRVCISLPVTPVPIEIWTYTDTRRKTRVPWARSLGSVPSTGSLVLVRSSTSSRSLPLRLRLPPGPTRRPTDSRRQAASAALGGPRLGLFTPPSLFTRPLSVGAPRAGPGHRGLLPAPCAARLRYAHLLASPNI